MAFVTGTTQRHVDSARGVAVVRQIAKALRKVELLFRADSDVRPLHDFVSASQALEIMQRRHPGWQPGGFSAAPDTDERNEQIHAAILGIATLRDIAEGSIRLDPDDPLPRSPASRHGLPSVHGHSVQVYEDFIGAMALIFHRLTGQEPRFSERDAVHATPRYVTGRFIDFVMAVADIRRRPYPLSQTPLGDPNWQRFDHPTPDSVRDAYRRWRRRNSAASGSP